MIIENQNDVTTAVLAELARAPNARFREIMSVLVRHLHDFVREAKLTEEEFLDLDRKVGAEVDQAVAFAESGAWEPVEDLARYLYAEETPRGT